MSLLASGVVMVTTRLAGRPWGVTVSSFASVSADPPTALVSLETDTAGARAIDAVGSFGVSILGRHHGAVARHGSRRGEAKFLERFVARKDDSSNPAVTGALAQLECDVTEQLEVGDHTIFVGAVREVRAAAGGEPLVYFRRAYRALAPTVRRNACFSN
jgi:3-hydroxy-9,10-secoandrosta-1,3,5(10)-triene-9,17-dione monooxygenase reductase component